MSMGSSNNISTEQEAVCAIRRKSWEAVSQSMGRRKPPSILHPQIEDGRITKENTMKLAMSLFLILFWSVPILSQTPSPPPPPPGPPVKEVVIAVRDSILEAAKQATRGRGDTDPAVTMRSFEVEFAVSVKQVSATSGGLNWALQLVTGKSQHEQITQKIKLIFDVGEVPPSGRTASPVRNSGQADGR